MHAVPDAAREAGFEEEEGGNLEGVHVTDVHAAVGLDAAAAAQDGHPVDVAQGGFEHGLGLVENVEFGFDDPAGDGDSFEVFSELGEQPALIVRHGLVGEPLEHERAGHDRAEKIIVRFFECFGGVFGLEGPVDGVEIFPHLRGDEFAHAAGVFAGAYEAVDDAVGVLVGEGHVVAHPHGDGTFGGFGAVGVEDGEDAFPLAVLQGGGEVTDVDEEIGIDPEDAGDVFGALDVASHPVDRIGIAGEHGAIGLDRFEFREAGDGDLRHLVWSVAGLKFLGSGVCVAGFFTLLVLG